MIIGQWIGTINRLWDLYDKAFPDQVLRDAAAKDLGIVGTYHSLALALIKVSGELVAGALAKLTDEQKALLEEAGTIPKPLPFKIVSLSNAKPGQAGCEIYGRLDKNCAVVGNQTTNPRSPICPIFPYMDFIDRDPSEFKSPEDYQKAGAEYLAQIATFFDTLPKLENIIASKISSYAASRGVEIKLRFNATVANLTTAIKSGAVRAQAAAAAAAHGSEEESARQVGRAERAAKVSDEAFKALVAMVNQGSLVFPTAKDRIAAVKTVESAQQAVVLAHKNHEANKRNRMLLGAVIVAGVGASAYMLLKRNHA
jgi:hypothetical protein